MCINKLYLVWQTAIIAILWRAIWQFTLIAFLTFIFLDSSNSTSGQERIRNAPKARARMLAVAQFYLYLKGDNLNV